jgi:predicted HNH restriction endonuclease
MSIDYSIFKFAKGSRLKAKTADRRDDEKRLAQMRAIVIARAGGRCERCERRVIRTLTLQANRAEVHHKRGRNVAPQDKFNPDACECLCLACHSLTHWGPR